MSSNIRVIRVCQFCDKDFTAKTTVTKYCSDVCSKRAYKQRLKEHKIKGSNHETGLLKESRLKPIKDINKLDYLNPSDAAKLLQCSRVFLYDLMSCGKIPFAQLSVKKRLIRRSDIDSYINSLKDSNTKKQLKVKPFDVENCISMQDAQERYNVSEKALYDILKRHEIRKQRLGKYTLVEIEVLDKIFGHGKS